MGYVPVDKDGSQLLFRVISDSYESKSLILTTNLEFSKWGEIFTDEQMAAAMMDRLVYHGHLLIFEGRSYRMEHALAAGFSVAKDALAYEQNDSEAAKTYVNVIAAKEDKEENEGIVALVNVLKSDDIKKCINETYDGAVIPFEEEAETAETAETEKATE